jgi:hypothetical protein
MIFLVGLSMRQKVTSNLFNVTCMLRYFKGWASHPEGTDIATRTFSLNIQHVTDSAVVIWHPVQLKRDKGLLSSAEASEYWQQ